MGGGRCFGVLEHELTIPNLKKRFYYDFMGQEKVMDEHGRKIKHTHIHNHTRKTWKL